ncbi:hypothetical protein [Aquimarina sp. RZ0]|uniref:hypothetical protein n=1 Tax=Aquimarina sp. RZ0 TaxID=2607730 RepID=UPI0011F1C9A2|nr:hypothetical protein [Aquimarina sp. RZ0]KAA1243420.1 hypothetical protein F0000_21155 [Aquimarina sp. RZ0]
MYFKKIKYFIYISIFSFCFCGCESTQKIERTDTYFGGEIINPNTDYIILSRGNNYGDTIYLDKQNRFVYKVEDLEEGLYSFRHKPENQLVLLEKGDSILIRLNTLDFDESLVFTGDGARKNNFLIDMFLQNEMEREDLQKRDFRLPPVQFKLKQDSLLNLRSERYNRLIHKYDISELSKKICKSSFEYDFYSRYEIYYYRYQYYGLNNIISFKEVPSTFFDYQNGVDFNDDHLKRLYSYNRFLNHYFTNTAYSKYSNKLSFSNNIVNETIYKLDLIDSLIRNTYIKNNLLRGITTNFILDNKNDYSSKKVLNHYLSRSNNKKFQKELVKLARATSRLKPQNKIPDQELISSSGETTTLSALFEKPITALYFWSIDRKDHYIKAHKKTSYLSTIYPEIDFIAINTDDSQTSSWLKTIKRHHFNLDNEYEFKFPKCSSEELVIYYSNKVILVDSAGKIINPNADLFSPNFEKKLISYTKLATLEKQKTALD